MTDIPITANERKAQFTGNTGLGPFAFTFNVLVASDLRVLKNNTVLTITTEYTVSLNSDGTGSITLTGSGDGTAVISSDILTIIGGRQLARTSDYVQGGNLFAEALNEDLDSIVIMMQQLDEKVSRTMRIDAGDVGENLLLPSRASRLNRVLQFNATTGDPEAGPTAADVANAQTNAANAAASASAAASSASAAAGSATAAAGSASAASSSASAAAASKTAAETAEANTLAIFGSAQDVTDAVNAAEAAQLAAETAETNAAASETAAATSETNAASSASSASTSATNAANSATAAATSETNAATSETNAANSATAAATSETNAAASETAAAASAADAENRVPKTSDTGAAVIPTGTEAQRDGTPLAGYFRFNSDVAKFEGYNGTAWGAVGGGATGGGGDEVFVQNGQVVTTNYTIPADKNAMSTGPITINAGVTVTVSTGARYVVL